MVQLPLYAPESKWALPSLTTLPSWMEAKRVAIDVETRDELLKKLGPGVRRPNSYVVGVSFAIEDGPAHYLPIRHATGTNLPVNHVLDYLRDQAGIFQGDLVGANLQYDLDYLLEEGVEFHPRFFRDVQIAEPLLDELQESYSLQAIAERRGIPGKDTALLELAAETYRVDCKRDLWQLPPEYVGPYGEQDVRLPLALLRRQERRLEEEELWPVYDLESRLIPVLVRMRRRGVRVDFDQLEQVELWSLREEALALSEIKRLTGVGVATGDVWRPEALATALKVIGVEVPKTPKTNRPSVTAALLESIDHPVGDLIRRARKVNKLRTTFANSIREHVVGDRIHCTFNQLRRQKEDGVEQGARYGRCSSSDPNLQHQPSPERDPEVGAMWRAVYVPDEGAEWACLDYSQQEPRWAVHYAGLSRRRNAIGEYIPLPRAAEAVAAYRDDPNLDHHNMMTLAIHGREAWNSWEPQIRKRNRNQAKIIFLGLCYGMGGAKLCHNLGLPTDWVFSKKWVKMVEVAGPEGAAIISKFDQEVPFVRQLAEFCQEEATSRGWIHTVLGRRCRFPQDEGGNYDWCHKALNRIIQGSSADQMKKAMVDADEAGIEIQLQVHDELDLSTVTRKETIELEEIMINSVPCSVRHKVDREYGQNWGALAT